MRRAIRALAALGLLAGAVVTAFAVAGPAAADTQICEQYGSTTIGGRYVVMNNRWGTSAQQCINVTSTGFSIQTQQGTGSTSGAPVSYPAVYLGCHYTNCSPGTNLPMQVSAISSATSSINYQYISGATYDAAYDIWLDPTPRTDGVNRTEIMVWFNHVGGVQPVGSPTGSAIVAGRSWQVWSGNNGTNDVLSFVAPSTIDSWNFDVMDFARNAVSRGLASNDWYLTSIQAGFEPWQNGAGLAVTSFSSAVNLGGGTPGDPGGPATCKVSYGTSVWPGGFTADVTVANTGSSPINGWNLAFTLPGGQRITNAWNAAVSPSSGSVTAANVAHNAYIAPGGQASFGFQCSYSGSFARPASFSLNGTACTTA
jgi:hypothetical protein